ncbi:hypothetical protein L6452_05139 [Arctium lappa]|uniref:Uncharacterized protein n=1 Tax=Arctium lappa TaxID=4217 RepID=A0ACB9EFK1_ARCLA|nr:hypothetical protein L6452_05139 [Arctium lappa]
MDQSSEPTDSSNEPNSNEMDREAENDVTDLNGAGVGPYEATRFLLVATETIYWSYKYPPLLSTNSSTQNNTKQ